MVLSSIRSAAGGAEPKPVADPSPADDTEARTDGDLTELSFEELMQNVDVVFSASRVEQPISTTSVPISIITENDIHYSGLTNIAEVLQFTPGVDYLQVDRNDYAVGVHGLHEVVSDRLLTLVNGRQAINPAFGGAEWSRLPLLPEDIEQIEVVRGPGGAAWGPNAYNGVVNIITKDLEEVQGWLLSTQWNEFADNYNFVRWGDRRGDVLWRISLGYDNADASGDVIDDAGFTSRDFNRTFILDSEALWNVSDVTRTSFGFNLINHETGGFDIFGHFPRENHHHDNMKMYVKSEHQFNDDIDGYVQWYSNIIEGSFPEFVFYQSFDNNLESQLNWRFNEKHDISLGVNFNWHYFNQTEFQSERLFNILDDPSNDWAVGGFLIDNVQATERLTLEAQIRSDFASATHGDWAGRLSGLYDLDEAGRHVLRLSGARAFRVPQVGVRDAYNQLNPPGVTLPPGMYAITILPASTDIKNENIASIELGYTGKLSDELTLRSDSYFQELDNLIGANRTVNQFGQIFTQLDNVTGAKAWGSELELIYENKKGSLSLWYGYNDFKPDQTNETIRGYRPAKHKFGATGRMFLPMGLTLNSQYRHATPSVGDTIHVADTSPGNRWDITLAKAFLDNQAEIMIGVHNILEETNNEVVTVPRQHTHETPGRTFFARLQWAF